MRVRLDSPEQITQYQPHAGLPYAWALIAGTIATFLGLTIYNLCVDATSGQTFIGCIPIFLSLIGLARCLPTYLRRHRRGYTAIFRRGAGDAFMPVEVTDEDPIRNLPYDAQVRMCISTVPHRPSYFLVPERNQEGSFYWGVQSFEAWISTRAGSSGGSLPWIAIRCQGGMVLDPVSAENAFEVGLLVASKTPNLLLQEYRCGREAEERAAAWENRYDIDVSDRNNKIRALQKRVTRLLWQRFEMTERFYGAMRLLLVALDYFKEREIVKSTGAAGRIRLRLAQHMKLLFPDDVQPEHFDPAKLSRCVTADQIFAGHIQDELQDQPGRARQKPDQVECWLRDIEKRQWTLKNHSPGPWDDDTADEYVLDEAAWAAIGYAPPHKTSGHRSS